MLAPISLADARAHLGVETMDEDSLIEAQLLAATRHVEAITSGVLAKRPETFVLDRFPSTERRRGEIRLPLWPVDAATIVLKYLDPAGVEQSFAGYRSYIIGGVTRLAPKVGAAWPVAADEPAAVTVTAQVGFAPATDQAPSSCPDDLEHAVRLLLGHFFANRENVVSGTISSELAFTVEALCSPHRKLGSGFA